MKIKPEHYAIIQKAISDALTSNPTVAIEYQAAGFTPMRLRWDMLWQSGVKVGDSVGMTCPPDMDPAKFVPLYDYANDDHIDTALRKACADAGCAFGAYKDLLGAPALTVTEGKQFTQRGFVATLERRDTESLQVSELTCFIDKQGMVFPTKAALALISNDTDHVCVRDIAGDAHDISVNDGIVFIDDMDSFAAKHSQYCVTTYDKVTAYDDEADEESVVDRVEEGRWENEPMTFDSIRSEARNHSYSEYNGDTLSSTDPSGTDEYYRHGTCRFHHMRIDSINGQPPTSDQIAALASALDMCIRPSAAMRDEASTQEPSKAPRLGM